MVDKSNGKEIPVVFAIDDNYAPFLSVSIQSIIENASQDFYYKIFILNTGIEKANQELLASMSEKCAPNVSVEFVDVADRMSEIGDKLHLRDYYTNAIFYRVFIPSLFPGYEKILYADSDIVFTEDVSKLFEENLDGYVFGVTRDEIVPTIPSFADYVEQFLGLNRNDYFNSGLLLFNSKEYKKQNVEHRFIEYMLKYKFEIAPDQDCLNVLCIDSVKYINPKWNKTPMPELVAGEKGKELKAIHFKMKFRPWKYDDILYQDVFWKYATKTPYYDMLLDMRSKTTAEDKLNDEKAFLRLIGMAKDIIESDKNFLRLQKANAKRG